MLHFRYSTGSSAFVQRIAEPFYSRGSHSSAFSLIGILLKPQTFAGLFGAAPSVAIATLALTILKKGTGYAALEARSMLTGALALGCYCLVVSLLLQKSKLSVLTSTLSSLLAWFSVAFGVWCVLGR